MKKVSSEVVAVLTLVILTASLCTFLEGDELPNLRTAPSNVYDTLAIKKGEIELSSGKMKTVPGEVFAKPSKG